MEVLAVIVMIVAGGAIAVAAWIAVAIARRERDGEMNVTPGEERQRIASALLYHIAALGGPLDSETLRDLRNAGIVSAPVVSIDISSWGGRFASLSSHEQCEHLLDSAVRIAARRNRVVPLHQYTAILDLSFALGFHTDALARMREKYPLDYVDNARHGRPREADRSGGVPLFVREPADRRTLLRTLELDGEPTRQEIMMAYRKLVARHHPDRFHEHSDEEQHEAATRFIEITRAYEALLAMSRD